MMLLVSLLSTILLVTAKNSHSHDDVGAYGHYNTWRQAICEKNDQDLLKDLDVCFKKEDPICRETVFECMTKVDPSTEGDFIAFNNAACQDLTLFSKFDECFEKYAHDEEFSKHMKLTREEFECHSAVLTKHGLDELQEYLKKELED